LVGQINQDSHAPTVLVSMTHGLRGKWQTAWQVLAVAPTRCFCCYSRCTDTSDLRHFGTTITLYDEKSDYDVNFIPFR